MGDLYRDDILQVADDALLYKLRDLYERSSLETVHIYNYLSTVVSWKNAYPTFFTILVPSNAAETGTLIGVNKYSCHELIISTLEETCDTLYNVIVKTKRINWSSPLEIFSLPGKLYPTVKKALQTTTFETEFLEYCSKIYITKEKALKFTTECPHDVYIAPLKPIHGPTINHDWPSRHLGSENYHSNLIQMNGGFGVFLKSNHRLVAWTVYDTMGISAVRTHKEFLNRGYGKIIVKYLSRHIAKNNFIPVASIVDGNTASEIMFQKLGFDKAGTSYYILNKQSIHLRKLIANKL